MTYFPTEVFTLILSYCDTTVKDKYNRVIADIAFMNNEENKELYSNNIYETYQGCRYIIDRVNNQDDLKGIYNYYESKEEELDKKFFLRYPLLNGVSVDHSKEMVNHVEDYIKLKEFCNV